MTDTPGVNDLAYIPPGQANAYGPPQLRPGVTYYPGSAGGKPMTDDGRIRQGETMTIDPKYRDARQKEMEDTGP